MKKLIIILALLPTIVGAQSELDTLKGCYAGTFMFREEPDTNWTTVISDTLYVYSAHYDTVQVNGYTFYREYVNWYMSNEIHTFNYNDYYGCLPCTFGWGFNECSYSTLEEMWNKSCQDKYPELVFVHPDSIYFVQVCFKPGQFEAVKYVWFEGKRYTKEIPEFISHLSINNNKANKFVANIYPNPTNGIINIKFKELDKYKIQLFSINGKLLYTNNYKTKQAIINLKPYKKGVYFIRITNKNEIIHKKIIKL